MSSQKSRLPASLEADSNFYSQKSYLSTDMQVGESVQIWAWLNQGHFSESTKTTYIRIIKDFLKFSSHVSLKQITPAILTLYIRKKDRVSASTRNLYRNCLSSLFQYLENVGYISKSPAKVIRQEKLAETFHYKVLSYSQVKRMTEKSLNTRDKLIILILYYTGLRVSELAKIRVKDFAVSGKKGSGSGAYLTVLGKGGKLRTILTGPFLWPDIRKYIKKNKFVGHDFLFQFEGKALSRISVYKIIKKATLLAKIKVPGGKSPSPHWFRHTSAIHALENGADIHIVQSTLGHSSLATTGKYLRARPLKSNSNYLKKF